MTIDSRMTVLGSSEPGFDSILSPEALTFITRLHDQFAGCRQERLNARMVQRKNIDNGRNLGFLSDFLAPLVLVRGETLDDCVVVLRLGVLRMEPDFEGERARTGDIACSHYLCFVVLFGGLRSVEPHLDAVPVRLHMQRAEFCGEQPADCVLHVGEQGWLHLPSMTAKGLRGLRAR